jgi:hypothetical protein
VANGSDVAVFIGGGSGPTRRGSRLHASWPLVLLSVGPDELSVRGRGPFRRLFAESIADPHMVTAELVQGHSTAGVVIQVAQGDRWLFRTRRKTDVLSALTRQGATVVPGVRKSTWGDVMGY